ncbi:MAG: arylesterase [Candidatus Odyssella sp.]|nr:arylesterase [Candidatus Odyssella sp.]
MAGLASLAGRALALALFLTAAGAGSVAAQGKPVTILAFGDSLVAGFGLGSRDGFTAKLEAALRAKGVNARVVNAGLSGDTSAGGLARLDWALEPKPDFAIVELGANDGLRGLDPAQTRANLDAILAKLKAKGVPALFAGMYAPPNMGPDYGRAFNALYPDLAKKHGVLFYPFFLDGVAADASLNQPDGIHPNAKGVDVIVARILPHVLKLIGG